MAKEFDLRRAARTLAAISLAECAALAFTPGTSSAAQAPPKGTVIVTIATPAGVPAGVTVRAKQTHVLAKAPKGRSARFKLTVPAGSIRVTGRPITFNGAAYQATVTRSSFTLRRRATARVRVAYRAIPAAQRLRATAVQATRVSFVWDAPARAVVRLRRTPGERPAASFRQGTAVATKRGSAIDAGLKAGTKYSYALFTRSKQRWVGPITVVVGTVSSDPNVAAYVAPPSTVIVEPGDADAPTVTAGGVSVRLASSRPTPLVGAGFVLPVSAALPSGYLGKVASVSPDGRTVQLVAAGLADAFDFYKINADLGEVGPITLHPRADAPSPLTSRSAPRALGAGLKKCLEGPPGGSSDGSISLHPIVKPSGHFSSSLVKKWGAIPVGATFDLSAQLQVGMTADLEVNAAISCGLGFDPVIKDIALTPVPIAIAFDPVAEVSIAGQISSKNVGYTATGGFWAKGSIGLHTSVDGGLIKDAGPTPSTSSFAVPLTLSLGGELTVGPGGGTADAGVIAGVGGKIIPIKASFGPVFGDSDLRHNACIKTTVGFESELNLNAKAWLGSWKVSRSLTLDALQANGDYGGPWYLPSDCDKLPDPTPPPAPPAAPSADVLGPGVQEVSSSTTGDSEQWGHVDGFAPGQKAWILGTGKISDADVDDPSYFASSDLGNPGNPLLSALIGGAETYDGASYRVTLRPAGHTLHVGYLFASEEYPEYVGEGYDDVMAVFVGGTNCANVPGTGDRVSVDSINDHTHSEFYVDNQDGAAGYATSMDGVTVPLTCTVPVTPGQPVTVEVAVADSGDHIFDSVVGLFDKGIWSD